MPIGGKIGHRRENKACSSATRRASSANPGSPSPIALPLHSHWRGRWGSATLIYPTRPLHVRKRERRGSFRSIPHRSESARANETPPGIRNQTPRSGERATPRSPLRGVWASLASSRPRFSLSSVSSVSPFFLSPSPSHSFRPRGLLPSPFLCPLSTVCSFSPLSLPSPLFFFKFPLRVASSFFSLPPVRAQPYSLAARAQMDR